MAQPSRRYTSCEAWQKDAQVICPSAQTIFATEWRASFGQHEHSGTVQYHSRAIAFKGQGVWMWFVGWDLAAVAGPCFGTCTLYISACPATSLPTDPQE